MLAPVSTPVNGERLESGESTALTLRQVQEAAERIHRRPYLATSRHIGGHDLVTSVEPLDYVAGAPWYYLIGDAYADRWWLRRRDRDRFDEPDYAATVALAQAGGVS